MLDERRRWFVQGLAVHVLALEALRKSLHGLVAGPIESVSRLARALQASATRHGYADIAAAAARLETEEVEHVPDRIDEVLGLLRSDDLVERTPRTHLLIVSGEAEERRTLESVLQAPGRRIAQAGTIAEAERLLGKHDVELVLLGLHPGGGDGRDLLAKLRAQDRYSTTPILVLSDHGNTADRVECFALGADEFIGMPYDPLSLAAMVASKLLRSGEMSRWTWLDPLTGLLNRAAMRRTFEQVREVSAREGRATGIALIDLDRLKWVNDAYGHAAGDEVLCALAADLSAAMRASDAVGRWGGEEFLAVLPGAGEAGAIRVIEKALLAFRERDFVAAGRPPFRCTFSAGAVADSRHERMEEVVARADHALYLAKSAGRNMVHGGSRTAAPERQALLVEDDDVMSTVLTAFLQAEGFRVNRFADAETALAAAEGMKCSLAVLDIGLPGGDGLDMLKSLRKLHGFARVPVVMVTGVRGPREVVRAFSLGADDFIAKPFSPAELQARIHRLAREA